MNEVDKMDVRKKDKEENWPLVVKLKLNQIIEETDKSALFLRFCWLISRDATSHDNMTKASHLISQ